jgi:hypothetical protein
MFNGKREYFKTTQESYEISASLNNNFSNKGPFFFLILIFKNNIIYAKPKEVL